MSTLTDETLMQEVAQGALDRLEELFDRHHKHVYHFILKMSGDTMLSEDLTQDVFYKILKYRESYNNGRFVSWLFTIARNSLKTHMKKKQAEMVSVEPLVNLPADAPEDREDFSRLHRALARLDPLDRELLLLSRQPRLRYADLAEMTGSTTGAVKTRVSRALTRLRTYYFEAHE